MKCLFCFVVLGCGDRVWSSPQCSINWAIVQTQSVAVSSSLALSPISPLSFFLFLPFLPPFLSFLSFLTFFLSFSCFSRLLEAKHGWWLVPVVLASWGSEAEGLNEYHYSGAARVRCETLSLRNKNNKKVECGRTTRHPAFWEAEVGGPQGKVRPGLDSSRSEIAKWCRPSLKKQTEEKKT